MYPPFSENITTMVNKSAISVIGLMRGIKDCSYQSFPRTRSSTKRVTIPARNGMPR